MKIFLATDHAGFELKEKVKKFLTDSDHEVEDCGAYVLDSNDDYPDFVHKAAVKVGEDTENSRGNIFGGSGQGEAMVANRVKGVRAAVYYGGSEEIVKLSREHNDANILSLGARFITEEQAMHAIKIWLETPFSEEERHKRRIDKIA